MPSIRRLVPRVCHCERASALLVGRTPLPRAGTWILQYPAYVKLWRISRRRSLRRAAKHELRRRRTVKGRTALRQDAAAKLRKLDWRWPLVLVLAVHLPVVIGLFGKHLPDWLGTAWVVSATMIGFGVALVVFLLQAANNQSLSSEATFSAVVAHTLIVWPAAMALVFLISAGILARFAATSGGSVPWAETWALVIFAGQITAFGFAFARTLTVVSPAGVAKILRTTSRDAMTREV